MKSLATYMILSKRKFLINVSFLSLAADSLYGCYSYTLNNEITMLREQCLTLVYNNKKYNFEEFLEKEDFVSIQIQNLQTHDTKMYKLDNDGYLEIMNEVFRFLEENR